MPGSGLRVMTYHKTIAKPKMQYTSQDVLQYHNTKHLLEFNVHDVANLAEATFEVLFASMFRKAADVDLVRLESYKPCARCPRIG